MSRTWHYAAGGRAKGPISEGQLREMMRSGRLTGEDFVWTEGMDEWCTVNDLYKS